MHPNDPDNTATPIGMRVAAEADAILAECAGSLKASEDFALNFEALEDVRGQIIFKACYAQEKYPVNAAKIIGELVYELIRDAAERRARHELEMAGA